MMMIIMSCLYLSLSFSSPFSAFLFTFLLLLLVSSLTNGANLLSLRFLCLQSGVKLKDTQGAGTGERGRGRQLLFDPHSLYFTPF